MPAEFHEMEPDLAGACIQALRARVGKPPVWRTSQERPPDVGHCVPIFVSSSASRFTRASQFLSALIQLVLSCPTSRITKRICQARSVAHQPAGFDAFTRRIYRRDSR